MLLYCLNSRKSLASNLIFQSENKAEIVTDEHVPTVVVGNRYCLDELVVRNFCTETSFEDEYVYQLVEVDDEKAEDAYLLIHSSQWQGSHARARILSTLELREHLNGLGYDDDEYMEKIEEYFVSESHAS